MSETLKFKVWRWALEELRPGARRHLIALYREDGITRQVPVFVELHEDIPAPLRQPGQPRKCWRPIKCLSLSLNPACDREPDCLFDLSGQLGGEGWCEQTIEQWEGEFDARQ